MLFEFDKEYIWMSFCNAEMVSISSNGRECGLQYDVEWKLLNIPSFSHYPTLYFSSLCNQYRTCRNVIESNGILLVSIYSPVPLVAPLLPLDMMTYVYIMVGG